MKKLLEKFKKENKKIAIRLTNGLMYSGFVSEITYDYFELKMEDLEYIPEDGSPPSFKKVNRLNYIKLSSLCSIRIEDGDFL